MTRVTAVTALAFAAILSGCAQPGSQPMPAAAPMAATVEDSDGGRLLSEIVYKLSGTPEQRVAGAERQRYAWQAAMGACMTAKGATFEIPPSAGHIVSETTSVGNLLGWSMRYDDFKLAERKAAAAKAGSGDNPALLKLLSNTAAADRWIKIQGECEPATKAAEELSQAAGSAALDEKLLEELHAIQKAQAPDLDTNYRTCMDGKGIPTKRGLPGVMMLASEKFPPVPAGTTDPTKVEGWTAAVAFEKSAAAADWECRGAEAARLIENNADKLAAWADEHKSELDAIAAQWVAMTVERDKAKAAAEKIVKR